MRVEILIRIGRNPNLTRCLEARAETNPTHENVRGVAFRTRFPSDQRLIHITGQSRYNVVSVSEWLGFLVSVN